ncbi:hypothetical protein PsorP6_002356 [Peronosclerospora sorghi]|uniref:Uncharacterized protein n=1 Tax=Peronosclerospora sorghi TaxID=230839 RepID=A0ACC0WX81_9STRA|nr:hypothetical protein PsorP6_002356 [Peronosclerospora sorghi]
MGAVSSVRKLTVDSIALLELLEPKSVELAAKRSVRLHVQQLLNQQWPTCRILPFGSSQGYASSMHKRSQNEGIVVCFGGCDIDFGIYFEDVNVDARGQFSPQKRVDLLLQRVNTLLNTALLKFYGQVDPRVRPLVFAVKYWVKQRGINDSSHCAKMQLPAVHSSFHDLQSHMKVSELLQRLQSFPRTELVSTFGRTKPNSVGALREGFFDYYAHRFNLEDEVVSVRIGSAL